MADMSIDTIKSRLSNGARPNRFAVYFFCPPLGISIDSVLCKSANLPGKQIEVTPWSAYGVADSMPTNLGYDSQKSSFTFLCDQSFAEKQVFESWLSFIHGGTVKGNEQSYKPLFSYMNEYLGEIHVNHLRTDGSISHTVTLKDVFPVALQPQQLDYTNEGVILEVQVEFAFRYFTTEYKDLPQLSLFDRVLNTGGQILDVAGDVASVVDRFGGDGSGIRGGIQKVGGVIDSANSTKRMLGGII